MRIPGGVLLSARCLYEETHVPLFAARPIRFAHDAGGAGGSAPSARVLRGPASGFNLGRGIVARIVHSLFHVIVGV
jgi:hypothetical protein